MNIKFWNQPKEICLEKILNENLRKSFKRIWIVAGVAKDSGLDMILDSLEFARNMGTEVNVFLGIDRKNTSKDMLMKLLKLGCNLYVHINRDDNKVETRVYVFENMDGNTYVYESNGKFSEGGLSNNHCLIHEIFYSSDEKKLFENFKNSLLAGLDEVFDSVDCDEVKLLAEKGEILARIIDRKIPSIGEMYGNSALQSVGDDMYNESVGTKLFDIPDDNGVDIDIDIDIDGKVKLSEFSVEIEAKKENEVKKNIDKLASEKLSKFYEDKSLKKENKNVLIIKDIDDIDFANVNIFVCELNKFTDKGVGEGEIKLPNYLYENMSNFFNCKFDLIKDDKGKDRMADVIKCDILDVDSSESYTDDGVLMYETDKYFAIKSKILKSLKPEEGDIIRFIKNSDNIFSIELIRKSAKEYGIWEGFCKYTMKNSKRKFGIM